MRSASGPRPDPRTVRLGRPREQNAKNRGTRPEALPSAVASSSATVQDGATVRKAATAQDPRGPRSLVDLAEPATTGCGLFVVEHAAREFGLSDREAEVLEAAARGLSTKEIAFQMRVSRKTIEYFWSRLFDKLGCRSQVQVMALLLRRASTGPNHCCVR